MNQPKVVLHRLNELRLQRDDLDLSILQPKQRFRLLTNGGRIGEFGFIEFIDRVLFGSITQGHTGLASLLFDGSKSVLIVRDLATNKARVEIDGSPISLANGQQPGPFLFGMQQDKFAETCLVDGRDFVIPKGSKALQDHLIRVLTPASARKKPITNAPVAEDLDAVRAKRIALEKQLELMPKQESKTTYDLLDPPSMDELLRSLEQSREVEKRLIDRRIALTEEFKKTSNLDQRQLTPVTAPILGELEILAKKIEDNEFQTADLRSSLNQQGNFLARAAVIISLMISAGSAAIGHLLEEALLTKIAIGLAGIALLGVLSIWLARLNRIVMTTRQAKTLRSRRIKLKEKASKLCMRIGTAASGDDLSPEAIRTLVDRIGRRDTSKVIKEALAPFIDTDAELATVKKLARALESPLIEAAEIRDPNLPAVPLVRVTRAAMSVLADWSKSLDENCKRVERVVAEETKAKVERELVEQSVERMRITERTLELNRGRKMKPEIDPVARAAQYLNRSLLPILTRYLGESAPRKFTNELSPIFVSEPSSEANSFVALIVRLFDVRGSRQEIASIGNFVVDPGLAVGSQLEPVLNRLLSNSPYSGSISVLHTRIELERTFLNSIALEAQCSIGMTESEDRVQRIESSVYSGHDHSSAPIASPLDLLLEPASN